MNFKLIGKKCLNKKEVMVQKNEEVVVVVFFAQIFPSPLRDEWGYSVEPHLKHASASRNVCGGPKVKMYCWGSIAKLPLDT